jgi:hypothetical protein
MLGDQGKKSEHASVVCCYMHTHTHAFDLVVLSSYLHPDLPCRFFLSGFSTKCMFKILFSPMCATCPSNLNLLDFINPVIQSFNLASDNPALEEHSAKSGSFALVSKKASDLRGTFKKASKNVCTSTQWLMYRHS